MCRKLVMVACLSVAMVLTSVVPASAASVAPSTWAPKFCSTLDSFQQKLQSDGSAADKALSGQATDLKAAKAQLVAFLNKAVTNTKRAVQQLQKAGTPKTPNGAKIAAKFVSALQSAQSLFASAATTAASLSTTKLSKFESTSQRITAALNRGGTAIDKSFTDVKALDTSGVLTQTLQNAPACAFLNGTGSTTTTG